MYYCKKPVVIEAVQWNGLNLKEIEDFAGQALDYEIYDAAYQAGVAPPKARVIIHTLEGDHEAKVGDYIIKGVQGEFYPCKPEIFAKTYETVEEYPTCNESARRDMELSRSKIKNKEVLYDRTDDFPYAKSNLGRRCELHLCTVPPKEKRK